MPNIWKAAGHPGYAQPDVDGDETGHWRATDRRLHSNHPRERGWCHANTPHWLPGKAPAVQGAPDGTPAADGTKQNTSDAKLPRRREVINLS